MLWACWRGNGLEDLAYAQEYERVTGREVPVSICRSIDQYTDDPAVYDAWRGGLAEVIESAKLSVGSR